MNNLELVKTNLDFFAQIANKLSNHPLFHAQLVDEGILVIAPKNDPMANKENLKTTPLKLVILGMLHGNETVGLFMLNSFLERLNNSDPAHPATIFHLPGPVAFAYGNPKAGLVGERFTDYDLNRSFGRNDDPATVFEFRRAKQLEQILDRTDFLLDFHQTTLANVSPFFIFPYTKAGIQFARGVHSGFPIITHWGKGFSKDGCCSDEYIIKKGKTGITLELGKAGFDPTQLACGLDALQTALRYVAQPTKSIDSSSFPPADLYTWLHVEETPPDFPECKLVPNLFNFQKLAKGELIAKTPRGEICAKEECWILFPKYYYKDKKNLPAKEWFRLLKKIGEQDLP